MRKIPLTTKSFAIPLALALLICVGAAEAGLWAYTLTGASFNLATASFRINPNFTDPSAGSSSAQIAVIQAAATEWDLAGGSNFSFEYQGTTTNTKVANDGLNSVFYVPMDGNGALAVCYWWSNGGNTTGFDVSFFDKDGTYDFIWATSPAWNQFDIQSVATHELGHALGLAHSSVAGSTMFATATPGSVSLRTLHVDDIAGIQALYGQAPPPVPTIMAITPARGWVDGGETVTISGTDFAPGAIVVLLDGLAATNVTVVTSSTLTCTTPPGQGQRTVDVSVMSGSHMDTLQGGYTYDTLRSVSGYGLVYMWNQMECLVPEDSGKFFRAVLSTSPGSVPMSLVDPFDTRVFPLTWSKTLHWSLYDELFDLPYWSNTISYLDAGGHNFFKIWGLNDPQYAGLELHTCFFVVDPTAPSQMSTISNAVTVAYQ